MPGKWEELLSTIGVPVETVPLLLKEWRSAKPARRIEALCRTIGPEGSDPTWPVRESQRKLLRRGVYSPVQLLAWECAKTAKESIPVDFPFLFDLTAALSATLIEFHDLHLDDPLPSWPPNGTSGRSQYRELLQSVFRLREIREEREPLSVEISLPPTVAGGGSIDLKRFAQVVGRGVGVAEGRGLSSQPSPRAELSRLFRRHDGSPSTSLYLLRPEFDHVPKGRLSCVLRRDGLLTLATYRNPILNFYDGGWHIEDSDAGRRALDLLLASRFPKGKTAEDLPGLLIRLAHHMASHWHGGILAVVDDTTVEKDTLHKQGRDGPRLIESLKTAAKVPHGSELSLCDVSTTDPDAGPVEEWTGSRGLGRLFLTLAIQDGALLFRPDGRLHSAGRFVKESGKNLEQGGAGARAAKALARHGVALKISVDGSIKVFAESRTGKPLVPMSGLRIR
ncbi:MAG TPA: hypothetical protein VFG07_01560 [Thermoplasmata archaeon]|nr:hypothetical protein [Thermoplasmata archaeon]